MSIKDPLTTLQERILSSSQEDNLKACARMPMLSMHAYRLLGLRRKGLGGIDYQQFYKERGCSIESYIQLVQLQPYEDPAELPEIVQQVAGLQVTNWQKHKPLWYPLHC